MTEIYNSKKDLKVEVPSDSEQVFLVAKYDVLKHIRSKRLLAIGIILGLILVLIGWLAHISILVTLGVILAVVGVVLAIIGGTGRAVGGRAHWY